MSIITDLISTPVMGANNAIEVFRPFVDAAGRPMFPGTVDSTIVGSFRSCPQKFYRQYLQHWKPSTESVHLIAGGAFAKGLETARRAFFEGKADQPCISYPPEREFQRTVTWTEVETEKHSQDVALHYGLQALIAAYGDYACPPESAKSLERMCGALEYYFNVWPLGDDGLLPIQLPDGRTGIEFSFAEPLEVSHPVSGDPILYTGRADLIGQYNGQLWVEDDKTTSSLGASWLKQWEMRSQFTGYVWASQRVGMELSGALVRGVSILKTKYDHAEVMTGRAAFELDRWYDQTNRDVERMIRSWKEGYWDFNLDHACTEYGGCSMVRICKTPNPDEWLPAYFHQRVWDPLARRELTVQEWESQWPELKA